MHIIEQANTRLMLIMQAFSTIEKHANHQTSQQGTYVNHASLCNHQKNHGNHQTSQ